MKEFKKFTKRDIENAVENGDNIMQQLTDVVKSHYIELTNNSTIDFDFCLADCESPIEQMLAISLESLFVQNRLDIPLLVDVVAIEKQYEVICGDNIYRADFAIPVIYWDSRKIFLIECDGHEFHQKTKEQVERDNQRMRDLQKAGYSVIRFSGTEIYHRANKCALEIKNIIQAPAIEFIKESISNGSKQSR